MENAQPVHRVEVNMLTHCNSLVKQSHQFNTNRANRYGMLIKHRKHRDFMISCQETVCEFRLLAFLKFYSPDGRCCLQCPPDDATVFRLPVGDFVLRTV